MLEPQPRAPVPPGEPDFHRSVVLVDQCPGEDPVIALSCHHHVVLVGLTFAEALGGSHVPHYCSQCLSEWLAIQGVP